MLQTFADPLPLGSQNTRHCFAHCRVLSRQPTQDLLLMRSPATMFPLHDSLRRKHCPQKTNNRSATRPLRDRHKII